MLNDTTANSSDRSDTGAEARLEALLEWLSGQTRWDVPIRLRAKAAAELETVTDPALRWGLERLTRPQVRFGVPTFDFKLDELRAYARTIEDLLAEARDRELSLAQSWAARVRSPGGGQGFDFDEEIAGVNWRFSDLFPRISRYAFFAMCYSYLEHSLETICRRYHRHYGVPLRVDEIAERGILRCQAYLKKVVGMGSQFPDQTAEWQHIQVYRVLRNAIIHNDGLLAREFERHTHGRAIRTFVEQHDSVELNLDPLDRPRITLYNDFCPELIDTIERFLDILRPRLP